MVMRANAFVERVKSVAHWTAEQRLRAPRSWWRSTGDLPISRFPDHLAGGRPSEEWSLSEHGTGLSGPAGGKQSCATPRESACEGNKRACVPEQLNRLTPIDVAPLRG